MKSSKRKLLIIAIIVFASMLLAGCGTQHTCTSCGRNFRGNAYHGVFPGTTMRAQCAREYWYPLDIRNFRIR